MKFSFLVIKIHEIQFHLRNGNEKCLQKFISLVYRRSRWNQKMFFFNQCFIIQFHSFFLSAENDLICDCRLSWLIELKNQTKNEELRVSLDEIECLLKKSKDSLLHKTHKIFHNAIERPQHEPEDETEYYDDEPEGKTVTLMKLNTTELPCPEEASDPTELPLSRESIGFDMNLVKVFTSTSSTLRISLCSLLLIACLNILKFCWIFHNARLSSRIDFQTFLLV